MTSDGYADDLATALRLEQLDRDLFRGMNTVSAKGRGSLYGGQVAAQALMAAGLTVPDGRDPHSLHGYFLRPGRTERPVVLHVDRDRDGRSISARHVAAIQNGEVIFSMLASFHGDVFENVFDETPKADVPEPEACSPFDLDALLDVREVTLTDIVHAPYRFSDSMWVRAAHPLPPDRLTHACALTYLSDLGTGFGQMSNEELGVAGVGGPSIDHALWFHAPVPADEWVLLSMWPTKAVRARGLYHAAIQDAHGRLAGTLVQEHMLLRTL